MHKLVELINSADFQTAYGEDFFIIPRKINQDFVECFFSKQRQMCGGTNNMTAHTYGYNINSCLSIASSSFLKKKKVNASVLDECKQLWRTTACFLRDTQRSCL